MAASVDDCKTPLALWYCLLPYPPCSALTRLGRAGARRRHTWQNRIARQFSYAASRR